MYEQIQILNKFKTGSEKNLQSFFGKNVIKNIKICDIYRFNKSLGQKDYLLACELLHNPISQELFSRKNIHEILKKFGNFSWILEIGYLSGVTDNLGNTATEIVCEKLRLKQNSFKISSSQLFLISTNNKSVIKKITNEYSNVLVNKIVLKSFKEFIKDKTDILKQRTNSFKDRSITRSINLSLIHI